MDEQAIETSEASIADTMSQDDVSALDATPTAHAARTPPLTAIGRRDVQAVFALVAISILVFGLVPLAHDYFFEPRRTLESSAPTRTPSFIVDLNTATVAELALLPQVGLVLAERIVEERERGGPFESVEALTRTHGVGPERLERLRPFLTVHLSQSQPSHAPYRAARMPMDESAEALIVSPHSDLIFKPRSPDRSMNQ